MSRVTKKALEQTVLGLAIDVARENEESFQGTALPSEGTLVAITKLDRRLWEAAQRLANFKKPRRRPSRKADGRA